MGSPKYRGISEMVWASHVIRPAALIRYVKHNGRSEYVMNKGPMSVAVKKKRNLV